MRVIGVEGMRREDKSRLAVFEFELEACSGRALVQVLGNDDREVQAFQLVAGQRRLAWHRLLFYAVYPFVLDLFPSFILRFCLCPCLLSTWA